MQAICGNLKTRLISTEPTHKRDTTMKHKALTIALSTLLATGAAQASWMFTYQGDLYGAKQAPVPQVDMAALDISSGKPDHYALPTNRVFDIFSEGSYEQPSQRVDLSALEIRGGVSADTPRFDIIDLNF